MPAKSDAANWGGRIKKGGRNDLLHPFNNFEWPKYTDLCLISYCLLESVQTHF
jgi:hypothetical protein